MRKHITLHFLLYLIFNLALAFFIHRDIIFNTHNFGRHWDWSLYAKPELYENYFKTFLYAIKPNYHGYYDILSINLAEILFKGGIYTFYRLFFGIIPLPMVNKAAVFVVLPLISSIGIWLLGRSIVKTKATQYPRLQLSILFVANCIYTFSLLLIFDLHGGALNRQISSVVFPYFWTLLYTYFSTESDDDTRYIPLLSLLFLFFDISNIFYFASISAAVIFFKSQPLKRKLGHYLLLGVGALLIHAFWIHAFFIGNQLTLGSILHGRSPSYATLEPYSATFAQLILNIKTPHDLIEGIYRYTPFLFIPFLVIFGTILFAIRHDRLRQNEIKVFRVFALCYFFSTMLTLGTHSLFSIHKHLYQTGVLAFIGGALRFAPNTLSAAIVLLFLASRAFKPDTYVSQQSITRLLQISVGFLILAHLFNGSIITRILDTYPPVNGVNNEVGALYDYPDEPMRTIQQERLIYSVLPIPSWYSPIYTDNVFPKTSQGSLVDTFFLNKSMLYTNTTPLFSSDYFHAAINYPNDLFLSFSNVGRIMHLNETVAPGLEEYSFSKQWITNAGINQYSANTPFYNHPDFYPHVYSPDTISFIEGPLELLYTKVGRSTDPQNTQAAALVNQISTKTLRLIRDSQWQQANLEYKRNNTTSYYIVAHGVSTPFHVILANAYHPGWKAHVLSTQPHSQYTSSADSITHTFVPFPGNRATQATSESIASYLQAGIMSPIPNGTQQLGYVSKQYHQSIQNDMLQFDTQKPIADIGDENHFKANGFANAWMIDPKSLCKTETSECNQKQDIVIWVEFTPQIAYRYALLTSCISILMLIAVSYYLSRAKS